jgi:hypothetical protein
MSDAADAAPEIRFTRTVGRVTAFDGSTLTVLTPTGKLQPIAVPPSTPVLVAEDGTVDDVGIGDRIVFKFYVDSPQSAEEVIVLPRDDPHGYPVMEYEDQWVSVKGVYGNLNEIYLGYAKVRTTASGSLDDVTRAAIVFGMLDVGEGLALSAAELVVLPEDTTFGS